MTYNIHHSNPPSQPDSINIPAIVQAIKNYEPHLVALQEIDENTERSGQGNQAEIIAERLGMYVFFGKAIDFQGGQYGVAILSKYPISEQKIYKLPSDSKTNGEPRILATVKVMLPNKTSIIFGSTHLDSQKSNVNRLLQIKEISKLANKESLPMIIAGDFNTAPGSTVIEILDKNFTRTCFDCGPTIPVIIPQKAIDFIAFKPKKKFKVQSHEVINETFASDHLPIYSVLKY